MKYNSIYAVVAGAMLLAACDGGGIKETLGLDHKAPDEFRVMARPPLSVPPVFTLRPPAVPGETQAGSDASGQARKIVTGSEGESYSAPESLDGTPAVDTAVIGVTTSDLSSTAESQFLSKAGVDKKKTDIRRVIHEESGASEEPEDKGLFDGLVTDKKKAQPTVDAAKERERIETNKKEKKPVTTGETPTVKPKNTVLDKLF